MKVSQFFEDRESDSNRTEEAHKAFEDWVFSVNSLMRREHYLDLLEPKIYVGNDIYVKFEQSEKFKGAARRMNETEAVIQMGYYGPFEKFLELLKQKYDDRRLDQYLAKQYRSTFVHEYIHALDFKRTPQKTFIKSGVRQANFSNDPHSYFNDPLETNARVHQIMQIIKDADTQFENNDVRKVKAFLSHGITKTAKWIASNVYQEDWLLLKPKAKRQTLKRIVRMLEPYFTEWQEDPSRLVTDQDIENFALHAQIEAADRNYDLKKIIEEHPNVVKDIIREEDTNWDKFIETMTFHMDLIYHIVNLLTYKQRVFLDDLMQSYLKDDFEKRQEILKPFLT